MPKKKQTLAEALWKAVTPTAIKKMSISQLERRENIGFNMMEKLRKSWKAGKMSAGTFRKREYSVVKKIEKIQLRLNKLDIAKMKKKRKRKR